MWDTVDNDNASVGVSVMCVSAWAWIVCGSPGRSFGFVEKTVRQFWALGVEKDPVVVWCLTFFKSDFLCPVPYVAFFRGRGPAALLCVAHHSSV